MYTPDFVLGAGTGTHGMRRGQRRLGTSRRTGHVNLVASRMRATAWYRYTGGVNRIAHVGGRGHGRLGGRG